MAFTSGMVTNYKTGPPLLTTDVLNDKLSVRDKRLSGDSTTRTHRAQQWALKISHLVFISYTGVSFLE